MADKALVEMVKEADGELSAAMGYGVPFGQAKDALFAPSIPTKTARRRKG